MGTTGLNILIAEDDEDIARSLQKHLRDRGHGCAIAHDGVRAVDLMREVAFDVVLLDWRMPRLSGLDVCQRMRSDGMTTPVILLTALTDVSNKVQALEAGADDYLTKPFSIDELIARISAVVRRYRDSSRTIEFDGYLFDLVERCLRTPSGDVHLTDKESALLRLLVVNRGMTISRDQIYTSVWPEQSSSSHVLETTVGHLRKKLASGGVTVQIKALYGEGYVLLGEPS